MARTIPVKVPVMRTTGKEPTPTNSICLKITRNRKGGRKSHETVDINSNKILPNSSVIRIKGLPANSRIFIIKTCRERPDPSDERCWHDMADGLLTEHIRKVAIKVKDMRYLKKFLLQFIRNGMELSV